MGLGEDDESVFPGKIVKNLHILESSFNKKVSSLRPKQVIYFHDASTSSGQEGL